MIDKIKQAMKVKNYKFFESGDYNLNIIGIRNSDTGSKVTNVFDDLLTVSYKIGDVWHFKKWAATTDPGTKGVKEFHNAQGVARLVPGQYKGSLVYYYQVKLAPSQVIQSFPRKELNLATIRETNI